MICIATVLVALGAVVAVMSCCWTLRRNQMDFKGKVVAITGAASGIGKGLAFSFAKAGAHLVLLDLDQAGLTCVAAEMHSPVRIFSCDVSNPM